jgi:membrane peptidoglycan carboxypeptidase
MAFLKAGHGVNESFDAGVRQLLPSQFQDTCPDAQGGWGGPPYKFHNDENEMGVRTIMNATAGSINSIFLQMATKVDQCDTRNIAISLGIHRADGAADGQDLATRPTCVIGGCENNIAPISLAAAYAAIANQGVFCEPILVDSVQDPTGAVLPGQNAECGPSAEINPDIANTAAYAMRGVITGGTGGASDPHDGTAYIGKTGTTNDAVHTWMVGSSTKAATAVWVGNISGSQNLRSIRVKGIQASLLRNRYIFKPIAAAIDKFLPGGAFPPPATRLLTGSPVTVPAGLIGGTVESAQNAIETAELTYKDGGAIDSNQPIGTVAALSPGEGSTVPRGTTVTVYTSNGQGAEAPNVIGESYPSGKNDFMSQGFTDIHQGCEVANLGDPPSSLNTIVTQVPAAGAVVGKNTPVTLTVRQASCP